jgi:translation initiation factor 1
MSSGKNKKKSGLVYSTDPEIMKELNATPPPSEQELKVILDRKKRGGKVVTLIIGFDGKEDDFQELAKTLKTKCGTGGTAKEGEILLQGDFRDKVYDILSKADYKIRKV